jgi:hypothetical protein
MWQAAHRLIIDLKEGRFEAIIPKIAKMQTRARTHTHTNVYGKPRTASL